MTLPYIAALFAALAVVFGALAWRDHRRHGPGPNPARKARLRVAVIFAVVAVGLLVLSRAVA